MTKAAKAYLPFKRLIAILGSFFGIIVCSIFLWWWVLLVNLFVTKGHPFFIHERVGQNGKVFKLIKFRSMKIDADPNMTSGNNVADEYSTGFGKFLRKTSIDETPQLLNIFIGQMSFIGPRPLIDIDGDHITIEKRKENGAIALKPGLSGYAQIHGRTDVSPIEKAELDKYYLDHISLLLDIKIFIRTIFGIFGKNKGK